MWLLNWNETYMKVITENGINILQHDISISCVPEFPDTVQEKSNNLYALIGNKFSFVN